MSGSPPHQFFFVFDGPRDCEDGRALYSAFPGFEAIDQLTDVFCSATFYLPAFRVFFKPNANGIQNAELNFDGKKVRLIPPDELPDWNFYAILHGDCTSLASKDVEEMFPGARVDIVSSCGRVAFFIAFDSKASLIDALNSCKVVKVKSHITFLQQLEYPCQRPPASSMASLLSSTDLSAVSITHCGRTYTVPKIFAIICSSRIRDAISTNESQLSFTVSNVDGDFAKFAEMLSGEEPIITEMEPKFAFLIGIDLGIEKIISEFEKPYYQALDPKSALDGILIAYHFGRGLQPHLLYLKSNVPPESYGFLPDRLKHMIEEVQIEVPITSSSQFGSLSLDQLADLNKRRNEIRDLIKKYRKEPQG